MINETGVCRAAPGFARVAYHITNQNKDGFEKLQEMDKQTTQFLLKKKIKNKKQIYQWQNVDQQYACKD